MTTQASFIGAGISLLILIIIIPARNWVSKKIEQCDDRAAMKQSAIRWNEKYPQSFDI